MCLRVFSGPIEKNSAWYRQFLLAAGARRLLARWLQDNRPESPRATLLHNDWKLDNMAVDPEDPGRCVAVYDWDMCTMGDPLCDLGTLLCSWIDRDEQAMGPGSMPTQAEGWKGVVVTIAPKPKGEGPFRVE